MAKALKIFGILYALGNLIFFATALILTFSSSDTSLLASSAGLILLAAVLGILSGYWMFRGKFGWKRGIVMALSGVCTSVFLIITCIISPQLKQLSAQTVSPSTKKTAAINTEVQRLFLGVYSNDMAIVTEQLDKGVDVNARNETFETPLHVTQSPEIAKLLVARGANLDARNDLGSIPIFNKELAIATILLDAGTDINARNKKGNTLLMWYSYSGYLDGIKALVKRGADINVCNVDHHNALDIAEHFQPGTATWTYLSSLNIQPCTEE